MANYRFIDRKDPSRSVTLEEIDQLVCKTIGEEVNPDTYNPVYEFVVSLGMMTLMSYGGFTVGDKPEHRTHIDRTLDKLKDDQHKPVLTKLVTDILFVNYEFSAWR